MRTTCVQQKLQLLNCTQPRHNGVNSPPCWLPRGKKKAPKSLQVNQLAAAQYTISYFRSNLSGRLSKGYNFLHLEIAHG